MKAIEAAEPFVKRFARAALDVTRLETASAGRLAPHSHSIVAGASKPLSRIELFSVCGISTVRSTVICI